MPRLRGILIFRRNHVSGSKWHLPEHCRAAIWIEANVKGDLDALRAASRTFADKLATFEVKFPDAHLGAVVAFGNTPGAP